MIPAFSMLNIIRKYHSTISYFCRLTLAPCTCVALVFTFCSFSSGLWLLYPFLLHPGLRHQKHDEARKIHFEYGPLTDNCIYFSIDNSIFIILEYFIKDLAAKMNLCCSVWLGNMIVYYSLLWILCSFLPLLLNPNERCPCQILPPWTSGQEISLLALTDKIKILIWKADHLKTAILAWQ